MSLNTGSIVVVNALYTYRLIGPNSQGVKRASLMDTQHKRPSWGRFESCQIQKEIKYFLFVFFVHCFIFYSVDVAFVINTTINIFQSYNCSQLSCKRVLGQNAIKRFSIT